MPQKRTISKYIVPILIIIISILFFNFMLKSKPAPVQKSVPERAWSVKSMLIEKASHKPLLKLYGQIITDRDIQLTSAIEADVEKRLVQVGDTVKTGQLLLSLDQSRLKQLKLQRKAELAEIEALIENEIQQFSTDKALLKHEKSLLDIAKNAVERSKTLEKSLMASSSQLDDAKRALIQQRLSITRLEANIANHPTRLAQLKAKKHQAKTRLMLIEDDFSNTKIYSPIDGVVTAVAVDDAEHVRPGAALFTIIDTRQTEIRSLIPQNQYQLLHHSFEKNGVVSAKIILNDTVLNASLKRLPPIINQGQAGSYAFFQVDDPNTSLLIGETVSLYVELEPQINSVAVPEDAIYGTSDVFLVKDQRLKRLTAEWLGETLFNGNKAILIRSDVFKNGDELLISKFANAMHGLKVKSQIVNRK